MLDFPVNRDVRPLLCPDTPKTDDNSSDAGEEGHVVRGLVAPQSVAAVPLPARRDHRVVIVDVAVQEVEDIAADHGRKGHDAPVLRQTADAKCVRDQGREDAEKEAVREPGAPRDENQLVRVGYHRACKLGNREDDCGDEEAPEARHV